MLRKRAQSAPKEFKPSSRFDRGRSAIGRQEYPEAVSHFAAMVAEDPGDGLARSWMAAALELANRWAEALPHWDYLRQQAEWPEASERYRRCALEVVEHYQQQGRWSDAIALAQGIVREFPADRLAAAKLRALSEPRAPGGRNAVLAGVLALLLGDLGVHKFYNGSWGWGIVYLLTSWTAVPAIAGFVEGIFYLADQQRYERTYNSSPPSPWKW